MAVFSLSWEFLFQYKDCLSRYTNYHSGFCNKIMGILTQERLSWYRSWPWCLLHTVNTLDSTFPHLNHTWLLNLLLSARYHLSRYAVIIIGCTRHGSHFIVVTFNSEKQLKNDTQNRVHDHTLKLLMPCCSVALENHSVMYCNMVTFLRVCVIFCQISSLSKTVLHNW